MKTAFLDFFTYYNLNKQKKYIFKNVDLTLNIIFDNFLNCNF